MTQREIFEEWALSKKYRVEAMFNDVERHGYNVHEMNSRWEGWQAAIATQEPARMVLDLSKVTQMRTTDQIPMLDLAEVLEAIRTQLPTVDIITETKETR